MMPLPNGSSIMMRSRLAITTRPMPTIFFFFMASRMTAKAIVDSRLRHKPFDVDRARALNGDFGELIILYGHILVLAHRIAFDHVVVLDHIARDRVDHLPLQAIAGVAVQ